MKVQLELFNRVLTILGGKGNFNLSLVKKPTADVAGITSICSDMKHVLFLDFDETEKWMVENDVRLLQQKYDLPPFYLFTTHEEESKISGELSGNYHTICLAKFPVSKIVEMQEQTHCDFAYKRMFANSRYKSWVLRVTEKGDREPPKYLGIIGEKVNSDKEISSAHLKVLKALYDLDDIEYKNEDGLYYITKTTYKTAHRVKA